jgi:GTP-binding protein
VPFERNGQRFELIDTAGLRRKGKVFEAIEKFSVVKTLQAIESTPTWCCCCSTPRRASPTRTPTSPATSWKRPGGGAGRQQMGRVDDYQREMLQRSIETAAGLLKFAPVLHISANQAAGPGPAVEGHHRRHQSASARCPTPVLTRLLHEAVQFQRPSAQGMFRPKLRYAHQGGMNPPVIVIHGNSLEHVTDSLQALPGRALSQGISTWSARPCASK